MNPNLSPTVAHSGSRNHMNPKIIKTLTDWNACSDAIEWLHAQQTWSQAWRDCTRGDWMLWLLGRCSGKPVSPDHRKLVLAFYAAANAANTAAAKEKTLAKCADIVRKHFPKAPKVSGET